MDRTASLGYLLVAGGIAVALLAFGFGGGTARACPGIDSALYRLVGIDPLGLAITGIDVSTATIEWYDGCNWRTNSLVPPLLGILLSGTGIAVLRSAARGNPTTDR